MISSIQLPKDRTIVVYANYRSGPTAHCDLLSRLTGIVNYDELFHKDIPIAQRLFNKPVAFPCIIKIMPDQTIPKKYKSTVNQAFKIGITRRSLLDQTISYYICEQAQRWHYEHCDDQSSYSVPIDLTLMEQLLNYMICVCNYYNNSGVCKDIELYYEDIKNELRDSLYVEYIKPTNYSEVVAHISQMFAEYQRNNHC